MLFEVMLVIAFLPDWSLMVSSNGACDGVAFADRLQKIARLAGIADQRKAGVMTDQRLITPVDLGLAVANPAGLELDTARTLAERDVIALTLGRVGRNITHAARELGISRMTLYRLMDKHGFALRT